MLEIVKLKTQYLLPSFHIQSHSHWFKLKLRVQNQAYDNHLLANILRGTSFFTGSTQSSFEFILGIGGVIF